jgi:hypothetical protein
MPKDIPRQGHVAIVAPEGDERRPIIRAERACSRVKQGHDLNFSTVQTTSPLTLAMMPVFHELSRAEGPSQQGRKTPAFRLVGKLKHTLPVSHEISRADGAT